LRRRSLSELSGAAVLAAVTIGLGSLLASHFTSYITSTQSLLNAGYRRAAEAEGQLLALTYLWSNATHTNLLLYNYGWRGITIQSLYLDGQPLGEWAADRALIEPGEMAQLSIKGHGLKLVVVTELGRAIALSLAPIIP
jgi:hypothetical protein